jgi:hypothetical protein
MATDRIHEILEDFAAQIRSEIQRQAMAALGGGSAHARGTSNGHVAKARVAAVGHKGAKRDPRFLEKLQGQLLSFIQGHPGLRIEQINKQLGTHTKDLALPIRKLIAAKAIKTTGERRATTYSAGGGGSAKKAGGKRGRKAKA